MTMRSLAGSVRWRFSPAQARCVPKTLYPWGGYDDALYRHYKNPQDRDEFVAKLGE